MPSINKHIPTTIFFICLLVLSSLLFGQKRLQQPGEKNCTNLPKRFSAKTDSTIAGMVLIPGGTYSMGADNEQADEDEYPKHSVKVDSFWMDATEVTNAQFKKFVEATGYITTAEQQPDWEVLKLSLPEGTPRPPDSLLVPASLVFKQISESDSIDAYPNWWLWVPGASWKHPQGPGSDIEGKDDFPVVQVSWFDAMAYCQWAGKSLPTEAEWEWAARGGMVNKIYAWGDEPISKGRSKANSWEGKFPFQNTVIDGYLRVAPVKNYPPNGFGLYDMAGNVWEWCADLYHYNYYSTISNQLTVNPKGPTESFDPDEPGVLKRSMRGGSFLCNDGYCSGYRNARRMKSSPDTGLEHTGFRCVKHLHQ